ncbi:inositol polyphosphate 5-phosphatase OCRL-like isoform X2 [Lytechinus pictus]|uniref:inositol polyphosphate 5-phosphatase OCRL-like isoform X2 n=1 Tax=Lytechinus pictus TaxID=7653 RepID=UPI0030B9AE46
MDIRIAVQEKLNTAAGEQCIDYLEGTLVPDWLQGKRLLALVHCPTAARGVGEQGLLIFTRPDIIKQSSDIILVRALPIKGDFSYTIETLARDQAMVRAHIKTAEANLVIEVPFAQRSSNFFNNVKKSMTACLEKVKQGIVPQFFWMQRYQLQIKGANAQQQPTPDLNLSTTTSTDPFGMSSFAPLSSPVSPQAAPVAPSTTTTTTTTNPTASTNPFMPHAKTMPLLDAGGVNQPPPPSMNRVTSDPVLHGYVNLQAQSELASEQNLLDSTVGTAPTSKMVHPKAPAMSSTSEAWRISQDFGNNADGSSSSSTSSSSSSSSTSSTSSVDKVGLPGSGFEDHFGSLILDSNGRLHAQDDHFEEEKKGSTFYTNLDGHTLEAPKTSLMGSQPDIDTLGYASVKPFKPAGIREEILKRREAEYTFPHDFRVFVGTWNVNGKGATEDLRHWLAADPKPPDMYAIGFQELDLSKEAFLFNDSIREEEWHKRVVMCLHQDGVYIKLKLIRLVGMMLLVFIQERHYPYIDGVIAETVGTGIMGKMGNKGAVAVRFSFHNTSFCFINSHLAAHMEEYERRNQDYHDICARLKFERENHQPLGVMQHDVVIWMGDLNYRINDLAVDTVKALIDNNHFKDLLVQDQLNRQRELSRVFKGFEEATIGFRPTYKYNSGSDEWDSSEKQRVPAWCDRILHRGDRIVQKVYRSHMKLRLSDHKPVSALYDIGVKVVDEKRFREVVEEEIRKLDRQENEALPQVTLGRNELKLGELRFMEEVVEMVEVANTGQVNTMVEFVAKLDDKSPCKPWLKVEPQSTFMLPGDMIEVKLTAFIDKNTAAAFNAGKDTVEDILILHLENGKDYYITVTGSYRPSSFGASLEGLVRMHEPIHEMTTKQVVDLETNPTSTQKTSSADFQSYDIPKEIWMLVDYLFRNGIHKENLFGQEGLHSEVLAIRDFLDTGFPEEIPGSIHSVAESLLVFLASLREPVIPYKFYQKCLDGANNFTLCKQIMKQLPRCHRNVFKYLTALIRELLMHSDDNRLDAKTLATIFGELFLRCPPEDKEKEDASVRNRTTNRQQITRKKATFVYQFIINEYDD